SSVSSGNFPSFFVFSCVEIHCAFTSPLAGSRSSRNPSIQASRAPVDWKLRPTDSSRPLRRWTPCWPMICCSESFFTVCRLVVAPELYSCCAGVGHDHLRVPVVLPPIAAVQTSSVLHSGICFISLPRPRPRAPFQGEGAARIKRIGGQ